jgi:hypothetical protein
MSPPDQNGHEPLPPEYSDADRQELSGLAFFRTELDRLRDRGLITAESYATVVGETDARRAAIENRGSALACLKAARRLAPENPARAAELAVRARQAEPSRREAWETELDLRLRLRDDDAARSLAAEAASRFADFPTAEEIARRIEAREALPDDLIASAREALNRGDDDRVVALCTAQLAIQPDHFDATVLLAFACQRLERLDEALGHYRRLRALQPSVAAWGRWVENVSNRLEARQATVQKPFAAPPELVPVAPPSPERPKFAWKEVAGEFLLDHWQKLILCLAVLLIVVSSNVGAYQVLGPRLWSPVGKCVLGLVYTAMFAGLGVGLVRWGAERAGRIMLLTTLIVIPANFMLAGEMKLLTEPDPARLAVLALDAAALFVLIRLVASTLRLPRGATFLSVVLFVLSAFNVAASPGSPWPWAAQFAVFLLPCFVWLAAEVWVTTRFQEGEFDERRETTYFALGLLTFALVTGLVRTGVFALGLTPTLYAVPVMVLAVGCVHAAGRVDRFDHDPRHEAWLRFAGLSLSGLGFALALARPEGAVYSGSTLAAALMGLGLYSVRLRRERHPSYIYFAFGALFVAYFGAFYFTRDLIASVEHAARQALGYSHKLPLAFKAINGLVLSPVLAAFALYFRRSWSDERLSRHCHYLGVPFAIGACIWSGFEAKAAVIVLSGYALLFAAAVPIFAAPAVLYLATAALAGAVYFVVWLWPGTTLAEQALLAALLGFGYRLCAFGLRARAVAMAYRRPLNHSALALAALAVMAAAVSAVPPHPLVLSAPLAFLVVALTAALVNRDAPHFSVAFAAVATANAGLALLAVVLSNRWTGGLNAVQIGCATGALAFAGTALGMGLSRRFGRENTEPVSYFPDPLALVGFVQVVVTLLLCATHAVRLADALGRDDFAAGAVALGFAAGALVLLTRTFEVVPLAHLTVACGLGVWLCLLEIALGGAFVRYAAYSAATSAYALLLVAVEEAARWYAARRKAAVSEFTSEWSPTVDLFARALPEFEVTIVGAAVALGVYGLSNGLDLIATFGAGSLALLWATRFRPSARLVDFSIALAIPAALCGTAWRIGWTDGPWTVGWLSLTLATVAAALWTACTAAARQPGLALYVAPCRRASEFLTWFVFPTALFAQFAWDRPYPISVAALGVNTAVLGLLAWTRQRAWPTYRALTAFVLAVYVVVFHVGTPRPDTTYVLGLVAVAVALLCEAVGFALRARFADSGAVERLYARPLIVGALLLTLVACGPAYDSPWTMMLVALAFVVQVKEWPSKHWLYAAVVALSFALYWGYLVHWPAGRLVTAAMVVAYQLWIVALLTRRAEPALVHWLRLPERGYDAPLFNSAAVACMVAVAVRVGETLDGAVAWTDSAGLLLNLAVFALLMVKAYPHRGWIDLSVALSSTSAVFAAYPHVDSPLWWPALGMALSIAWLTVARWGRLYETELCRRLAVPEAGYSAAVLVWSRALFTIAAAWATLAVAGVVVLSLWGSPPAADPGGWLPWLALLFTLGLGGVYSGFGFEEGEPIEVAAGMEYVGVLALWWLAAPGSPLVARLGLEPRVYLPLATATAAAITSALGLWVVNRPGWHGAFWKRDPEADRSARVDAFTVQAGLALALLGAVMTRGAVNSTTILTLLIASAAPAVAAVARRWVPAGYAVGLLWSLAGVYGGLETIRRVDITGAGDRYVAAAAGGLVALFALWAAAGEFRRRSQFAASEPSEAVILPARSVPLALEHSGAALAILAALAVALSSIADPAPGRQAEATAVAVLFGVGLFGIGLILRWGSEWLVYATQAALLGAYLYYRWAFPIPATADAIVLTLFGYLNLGLAEVLHRIGLSRFARPTRYAALAAPLLPIALVLGGGTLGEARLLVLFAAATLYGTACYSMQWKSLGYAAAVLYNVFLWFLWGRFGWTVADHSQFFLVPAGLTAVLFAEVNRGALGRSALNAIRGVGLALIYLSLAIPVWQFAGLGPWLALLLISLAGIFVGIGLRVQVFLWFGLTGFVLDVVYQLGRMGMENTLAKWGIMLGLGLLLVLFVALNEKKRIVATMREYLDEARQWE